MKKKLFTAGIVAIFAIASIVPVVGAQLKTLKMSDGNANFKIETKEINFSKPSIREDDQYIKINLKGATSYMMQSGKPILPIWTTVMKFPLGTEIMGIECEHPSPAAMKISKKVSSAPQPIPNKKYSADSIMDETLYNTTQPYPAKWFTYRTGGGLSDGKHVTFLSIHVYPVRYIPVKSEIHFIDHAELIIRYKEPSKPMITANEYDLLIITPDKFSRQIQPLVEHKNNHSIRTKLVDLEGIYDIFDGRDRAEKIKYFIKYAIEKWGIKYVLLVGGMNNQLFSWHLPVRYTNLDDGSGWETGYISDLYYADIYKADGSFEDWDSNGNGVFAEWRPSGKDILDLYPDVYVGRIPCRNAVEVGIMVNKIITYETSAYGESWFKKMVVVGGDSAPGYKYYEGEEENKKALEWMPRFDPIRLWTSDGSLSCERDVVNAINKGCGFLFFDGHGNPMVWGTHPPDDEETWIRGLTIFSMPKLSNHNMLPVCVVGGCHNSQFNVTMLNLLKNPREAYYKSEWVPECWSWWLTRKIGGGSIATIGYTGLDWFSEGDYDGDGTPDCIQYYSGFANTHFFKNYGMNNFTILGEAHAHALIDYINQFPPMDERLDCKTVQEFALLGDPSLQIGGYR